MTATAGLVPLILYAVLITAAAVEDAVRLRISNITNVAILILGVVTLALNWGPDWWQHILAFAIALGLGVGMYSLGWFGGGDAKFLAATAFAFDLRGLLGLVVATAIAGGVLALLFVGSALFRQRGKGSKGRNIPYGIAIAAGAVLTWFLYPGHSILAA